MDEMAEISRSAKRTSSREKCVFVRCTGAARYIGGGVGEDITLRPLVPPCPTTRATPAVVA
jgi:hypothetical protein